jgi:DNA polymerase-3 subunit alpha
MIAYRTAWLKANHTAEYMAALISSVMSTKDKVPFFVARCEEMGIEIQPPDVNLSDHEFTVGAPSSKDLVGSIRFGLDAVKGVGYQAVEAIKRARDGGEFTSLWDFCERVDSRTVNKKAIEALIKCGALGSTRATRRGMLEVLEQAQAAGQKLQQDALIGQGSIFDLQEDAPAEQGASAMNAFARPVHPPIPSEEFDQKELLAAEKEAIGLFISEHPLKPLKDLMRTRTDCSLSALADRRDKEQVTVGGIITETKKIRTRNGDHMMFATLDDLAGSVEMLVFGNVLAEREALLAADEIVLIKGRVDHKEAGATSLVVSEVQRFAPTSEEIEQARNRARRDEAAASDAAKPVHLTVAIDAFSSNAFEDLKQTLESYPGEAEVFVDVRSGEGTRRIKLGEGFRVKHTPELRAELAQTLARGAPATVSAAVTTHPEAPAQDGAAARGVEQAVAMAPVVQAVPAVG